MRYLLSLMVLVISGCLAEPMTPGAWVKGIEMCAPHGGVSMVYIESALDSRAKAICRNGVVVIYTYPTEVVK